LALRAHKLVSGAQQILLFSDGSSAIPEANFALDQNAQTLASSFSLWESSEDHVNTSHDRLLFRGILADVSEKELAKVCAF